MTNYPGTHIIRTKTFVPVATEILPDVKSLRRRRKNTMDTMHCGRTDEHAGHNWTSGKITHWCPGTEHRPGPE